MYTKYKKYNKHKSWQCISNDNFVKKGRRLIRQSN